MKKERKNFPCKSGNHEGCHGKILLGSPTDGVRGIMDCECRCHGN